MKTRTVETVSSNEEFVRMRIFDGDLPADAATAELLRLERLQHAKCRAELVDLRKRYDAMKAQLGN